MYKEIWEASEVAGWSISALQGECEGLFSTRDIRTLDKIQLGKLLTSVTLAKHERLEELGQTSSSPQIGNADNGSAGQEDNNAARKTG